MASLLYCRVFRNETAHIKFPSFTNSVVPIHKSPVLLTILFFYLKMKVYSHVDEIDPESV